MNAIVKRIAAGTALAAAPVLVALGAATASHADTTVNRPTARRSASRPRTSCSPPRTSPL